MSSLSSFLRYCVAFAVIRDELCSAQCTVKFSDSSGSDRKPEEYSFEKCEGSADDDFEERRPSDSRQGSLLQTSNAAPTLQNHSGPEATPSGQNDVSAKMHTEVAFVDGLRGEVNDKATHGGGGQSRVWGGYAEDWDNGAGFDTAGNSSQILLSGKVLANVTIYEFISKVPSILVRGLRGRGPAEDISLALIAVLVVSVLALLLYLANRGKSPSRGPGTLPPFYALRQQSLMQQRFGEGRSSRTSSGSRTPIAGQSRHLCPGLVVPSNNECFLAVPAVRITPNRKLSEFDVKDLSGKPVIRVEIGPAWGHANATSNLLLTLSAARMPGGASPRLNSGRLPLLGTCKTFREESGSWSVYTYDPQGELYAHICKDPFRSCYTLTSSIMNVQLVFDGNLREHAILVTNEQRVALADTEPAPMSFDPRGEYFQLHVCSNVDVGLILCGLLAIEHLELF
jgi:hypothetical protein